MDIHQSNPNLKLWQDRYGNPEYAYGTKPNLFFREWLGHLIPNTILMAADGEGRNGVHAATLGWKVTSFDISPEGKAKAMTLAEKHNAQLEYLVGSVENMQFAPNSFDAIALIYAHFSADRISSYHSLLSTYLKPGGMVILEAFSKKHLQLNALDPKVGGPRQIDMLFSIDQVRTDFENYDIILLEEKQIQLSEGIYHNGKSSVVRFVGKKPSP
jgi:ubiquinone/menaquinone biosynthesis C-methylase UbiE